MNAAPVHPACMDATDQSLWQHLGSEVHPVSGKRLGHQTTKNERDAQNRQYQYCNSCDNENPGPKVNRHFVASERCHALVERHPHYCCDGQVESMGLQSTPTQHTRQPLTGQQLVQRSLTVSLCCTPSGYVESGQF